MLLVFAACNFGWHDLRMFQAAFGPIPSHRLSGCSCSSGAIGRFRTTGDLPAAVRGAARAEHIAWFDDLVREFEPSDPQTDELALDLPTGPHWKAKLLGSTAFFAWLRGGDGLDRRAGRLRVRAASRPTMARAGGARSIHARRRFDQTLPAIRCRPTRPGPTTRTRRRRSHVHQGPPQRGRAPYRIIA